MPLPHAYIYDMYFCGDDVFNANNKIIRQNYEEAVNTNVYYTIYTRDHMDPRDLPYV